MEPTQTIDYYTGIEDAVFLTMVKERFNEADGKYNGKKDNQNRKLKSIRDDNRKNYTGEYIEEQLIDTRYEEVFSDNRIFVNVRTVVPFVTGQLTAPEVTPAKGDPLSRFFALDFEKALQQHAERQLCKYKIRLSVQDLKIGERVGVGKWRYDAGLDTVVYEHVRPSSITIGIRSTLYEEPDFVRQVIRKTPGQLIAMFPDKKQEILEHFGIQDKPEELDRKRHSINEDWLFVWDGTAYKLIVGWSHNEFCFGKIRNPNWKEDGNNLIEREMMPYVFFNDLNDGTSHIDQTSYAEQAKYLQKNYNKRGQTIAENARYSGIGVPIFAKGSIQQKDAAKVHFSPVQRILLDTADVSKSFTTWQAQNMPQFINEDKRDLKVSIDDIYGSPDIMRGETSGNPTAAQDILVRDQAQGRQTDTLDMLEAAMIRFYQLEGQMFFCYFTEEKYFGYTGSDNKFVKVVVSSKDIRKNIGIQIGVKASTSLLPDRAQKRRTMVELAKMGKLATRTLYRELQLFDDPDQAYKEWVEEQQNSALQAALADDMKDKFDREANEDLQIVIGGKIPDERDDITPEYIAFLNGWLLTDKYKHLQEKNPKAAARVSDFIDQVLAQAQRKAVKQQLQPNAPAAPAGAAPAMSQQSPMAPPQPPMQQPNMMTPNMALAMQQPQPPMGNLPTPPQPATL